MVQFYKQNDDGEYVDADSDVDELFRQKSDEIIKSKLGKAKERETARIKEEIEEDVRKNAEDSIKAEVREALEAEYKQKLEESEAKTKQLDIALRRKTIAAEYGFKPDTEQFLGDGTDDEMRAKADVLKDNFGTSNSMKLEKDSKESVSKMQKSTGIVVDIK